MYICLDAYLSFGQNWKKRNIRFFKQKKHNVGEKSQIRCLIIDTNSGIVRKCHLRHVFCVIYKRFDGYFMERLSKHQEQKI